MRIAERPSFLLGGNMKLRRRLVAELDCVVQDPHEIGITDSYVHIASSSKESVDACVRYFQGNLT